MTTTKPELTKEIAYKELQEFFKQKPFLLFGTGTSCAIDKNFGMGALQNNLETEIPPLCRTSLQISEWKGVTDALSKGQDFEMAMNSVTDIELIKTIVDTTAIFIAKLDQMYSNDILSGNIKWPASTLIEKIVHGLPESDRILHIATPNYDLLAEYSFCHQSIPYITGFSNGICKKLNWKQSSREVTYAEPRFIGRKRYMTTQIIRHVRLYKVHGSLNTFSISGEIVENNTWVYNLPSDVERIMITPGTSKYEQLHNHRYELLGEFDQSLQNHTAFLFIGYGFNDNQINNNTILRKLKEQKSPGLIITRDNNTRIFDLASVAPNLWIVCKQEIAGTRNSRVFNSKFADWLSIDNINLWDPIIFSTEILGG